MRIPKKKELLELQKKYHTDRKIGEVYGVPGRLVTYWRSKKNISTLLVVFLLIIQLFSYIFVLGIFYLIVTQYFLRKKTVNFGILKNPIIYRRIKLLTIYLLVGFLLLVFLYGYFYSPILYLLFTVYFDQIPLRKIILQQNISQILNSNLYLFITC